MASLNRATIIGNVGKDPEIRALNNGSQVANLSVATSETWNDKRTGEKKESTEWHRVVIWNEHLVGIVEKYVRKGSRIMIEGQIKTRKWEDSSGVEKYSTEIVLQGFDGKILLLSDKKSGDERGGGGSEGYYPDQSGGSSGRQDSRGNAREDFDPDLDDEIPFASRVSIW